MAAKSVVRTINPIEYKYNFHVLFMNIFSIYVKPILRTIVGSNTMGYSLYDTIYSLFIYKLKNG